MRSFREIILYLEHIEGVSRGSLVEWEHEKAEATCRDLVLDRW
jgi:hypothetical protein